MSARAEQVDGRVVVKFGGMRGEQGDQGPSGLVVSTTPPVDRDVAWLDPDDDQNTHLLDSGMVGQPGGVAPLASDGKVPSSFLPTDQVGGQVDSVVETDTIAVDNSDPKNPKPSVKDLDASKVKYNGGGLDQVLEAFENGGNQMVAEIGNRLAKADNLSDVADAATARTNLGLGDAATLDVGTTAGTVAAGDDVAGRLSKTADLGDLADVVSARTNLGLTSVATMDPSELFTHVGSSKLTLSDTEPSDPADGDLWVDTLATTP